MSKELAIIELIAQMTGQSEALADDAYWDPETRQIYTADMLVENRHFKSDYFSPQDLGWKAAAVNISDIAAMGGRLKYLLVSLGLPEYLGLDWVHAFYQGLISACQQFGGRIAGGDTVSSDIITLNVTAIGSCPPNHHIGHRCNARAGDAIIATGFHGLSNIGLTALQAGLSHFEASKAVHLRPMPRVEAGLLLSKLFDRYALMDSSDGLADALVKIAQSSDKQLMVKQEAIPVHPEIAAYWQTVGHNTSSDALWQTILYGGEDFELVATVPEVTPEVLEYFQVIGHVEDNNGLAGAWLLPTHGGVPQALSLSKTYQHFRSNNA